MLTLRTVAVSVLVALAWGTAVGTVLVIQPELPIRLDLGLFVQSVAIGLVSSGMYAVPLGIVGGLVAARLLRAGPRGWDRERWIRVGALYGATIGALGPFAVFVFVDPLIALAIGGVGAVTGALCGATMGRWCARVERKRLAASSH